MKVVKFGGSSLASATQLEKVLNIVKSDPERRFVVVSAPGKRHDDDIKVTDALIKYYREYLDMLMLTKPASPAIPTTGRWSLLCLWTI